MTDAIVFENEKTPIRPVSSPVLSTRAFSHTENGGETESIEDGDGENFSDAEEDGVLNIVEHLRVNSNHQQKQQQQQNHHHQNNHNYHHRHQNNSRRRRQRRGSESKGKDRSQLVFNSDINDTMTSPAITTSATLIAPNNTATSSSAPNNHTSHNHRDHNHHRHHQQQQQPPSASSTVSSVSSKSLALPPLTANDSLQQNLKSQFFLGSTTFFDSFFGQDELDRFFPDHKLRLAVITWNMSSKAPAPATASNDPNSSTSNSNSTAGSSSSSYQRTLRSILMPKYQQSASRHTLESGSENSSISRYQQRLPELFVIGLQETPKSEVVVGQLKVELQAALGPNYALLQWSAVGVLHASVWIRRELLWSVTAVDTVPIHSRPTAANRIRTKGAVALSFSLFGTAFLFINTHLSAHETNLRTRINQLDKVQQILNLKVSSADKNNSNRNQVKGAVFNGGTRHETNGSSSDGSAVAKHASLERRNGEREQNFGKEDDEEQQLSQTIGTSSSSSSKAAFKTGLNNHSEYVFWFGDLNFRLELPQENVHAAIKQIASAPNSEERLLHQHRLMRSDQLTNLMARGMIFDGFHEAIWPPPFLPTYKCKMRSSKAVTSNSLPRLKTKKKKNEVKNYSTSPLPSSPLVQAYISASAQEAAVINQLESQSNSSNSSTPTSQSVESSASSITANHSNSPVPISNSNSNNHYHKPVPKALSSLATPATNHRAASRSVPLNLNSLTDEEEEDEEDEDVITASFNTSRVPSFTDRILYQARFATESNTSFGGGGGIDLTNNGAIRCLAYTAIRSVDSSDHKPVRALFEVDLDAGGPKVPARLKKKTKALTHSSMFFGDREARTMMTVGNELKTARELLENGVSRNVLSSSSSEQVLSTLGQTGVSPNQQEQSTKDKSSSTSGATNLSSFFGRRLGRKGRQKRKEFKLQQQQQERLLHGSVSMSSLPTAAAALSASLDSKLTRLNAGAFERQVFIDGLRLRNSLVTTTTTTTTTTNSNSRETSTLPVERHSKFKFGIGSSNRPQFNHNRSLYKSRSFDSNVDPPPPPPPSSSMIASTSVVITPPPPQRPQSEGPAITTTKTASLSTLSAGNLETDAEGEITSANTAPILAISKNSSNSNIGNSNTKQSNQEHLSKSSSICLIA